MATSRRRLSRIGQPSNPAIHAYETAPRPLVGYAFDYPSGHRTGRHNHPRAQLLYATEGTMRVETDDALYTVPPDRGLWVPAGLAHEVAMTGPTRMRALFLRADAARAGPPAAGVIAISPLLRELILAACAEPLEWDPHGRGGHVAALALDEIRRAMTLPFSLPAPRDPRLVRAVAPLRRDPADPRTLDELAAEAGGSVRTLARLFRAETGLSFQEWRQQLRLIEGWARLAAGEPPALVAAAVGYASAPAFGAAFRASFGITPGAVVRG